MRDMRFDEKIRVDLPDEAARAQILAAQLADPFFQATPQSHTNRLRRLTSAGLSLRHPRQRAAK